MAWNPSKEVAVARDAAQALDDSPMCIVLWVTPDGKQLGMASYGKTVQLCDAAKRLGKFVYKSALEWEE